MMERAEGFPEETVVVRDGVSPLVEASLRISETLDLETVLQDVVDRARGLAADSGRQADSRVPGGGVTETGRQDGGHRVILIGTTTTR